MNTEELQKKLEESDKEKDAYLNGWRRCKADFINYQKEELKRLEEMVKFGNEDLIRELLGVLGSLSTFGKSVSEKDASAAGVVQSQIESILKKRGLEKIIVSLGALFDPKYHESVGETESEHSAGTIAEEVEIGWTLYDKIIKASKVKLSKQK